MKTMKWVALLCVVSCTSGCSLKEIRSKSKFGPEFRTRGAGEFRNHVTRWSAQQGVELKWDNGINTAVTYRRRDDSGGVGNHDNGVWMEFSFPLWKAPPSKDRSAERIAELEQRLALLEGKLANGEG